MTDFEPERKASRARSARLLPRYGPKPILVTGTVLTTAAMAWLIQISAGSGSATAVLGPLVLFGAGMPHPALAELHRGRGAERVQGAAHIAPLLARELRRRTGSGSPATTRSWFA